MNNISVWCEKFLKIVNLKKKYQYYQERSFLKKHRCETWKEYYHRYDPDCEIRASRVENYYHGYQYHYCFDNKKHFAYQALYDYGPGGYREGYHDIIDWCDQNIVGKFRFDFLRVSKYNGTWELDELGGGDYIFAAFKDEKDYTYFLLRWT